MLYSLRIFVLFDLACLVLLHALNLLLILLVLNVVVSVQVVVQVDHLAKGDPVQDLDSLEGGVVKGESIKSDGENGRSSNKLDSLLGVLLARALFTVILVLAFEDLRLDVVF